MVNKNPRDSTLGELIATAAMLFQPLEQVRRATYIPFLEAVTPQNVHFAHSRGQFSAGGGSASG